MSFKDASHNSNPILQVGLCLLPRKRRCNTCAPCPWCWLAFVRLRRCSCALSAAKLCLRAAQPLRLPKVEEALAAAAETKGRARLLTGTMGGREERWKGAREGVHQKACSADIRGGMRLLTGMMGGSREVERRAGRCAAEGALCRYQRRGAAPDMTGEGERVTLEGEWQQDWQVRCDISVYTGYIRGRCLSTLLLHTSPHFSPHLEQDLQPVLVQLADQLHDMACMAAVQGLTKRIARQGSVDGAGIVFHTSVGALDRHPR